MSPISEQQKSIDVFDELMVSALTQAETKAHQFATHTEQRKSILLEWESALVEYGQMKRSYLLAMVDIKSQQEKNRRRACLEAYDLRNQSSTQALRFAKTTYEKSLLLPSRSGKNSSDSNTNPFAADMEAPWLAETRQIQDKTFSSLASTKTRLTETIEIGQKVGENLEAQADTIKRTNRETGLVRDEIAIASATLTSLARRIATDKVIMVFCLVLSLLVIAVIVIFATGVVKTGS